MTTPDDRKLQAGAPAEYSVPKDPMYFLFRQAQTQYERFLCNPL
jgi:hypothetical protein